MSKSFSGEKPSSTSLGKVFNRGGAVFSGAALITGLTFAGVAPAAAFEVTENSSVTEAHANVPTLQGPKISLDQNSIHKGESVTVSGCGFEPGEKIIVSLGQPGSETHRAVEATAQAAGTFTATLEVPVDALGKFTFVKATGQSSQRDANAPLTLLDPTPAAPAVDMLPEVVAGQTVTISLTDFTPGSTVSIRFEDAAGKGDVVASDIQVSGDPFHYNWRVPLATPTGEFTITVTERDGQDLSASTVFTIIEAAQEEVEDDDDGAPAPGESEDGGQPEDEGADEGNPGAGEVPGEQDGSVDKPGEGEEQEDEAPGEDSDLEDDPADEDPESGIGEDIDDGAEESDTGPESEEGSDDGAVDEDGNAADGDSSEDPGSEDDADDSSAEEGSEDNVEEDSEEPGDSGEGSEDDTGDEGVPGGEDSVEDGPGEQDGSVDKPSEGEGQEDEAPGEDSDLEDDPADGASEPGVGEESEDDAGDSDGSIDPEADPEDDAGDDDDAANEGEESEDDISEDEDQEGAADGSGVDEGSEGSVEEGLDEPGDSGEGTEESAGDGLSGGDGTEHFDGSLDPEASSEGDVVGEDAVEDDIFEEHGAAAESGVEEGSENSTEDGAEEASDNGGGPEGVVVENVDSTDAGNAGDEAYEPGAGEASGDDRDSDTTQLTDNGAGDDDALVSGEGAELGEQDGRSRGSVADVATNNESDSDAPPSAGVGNVDKDGGQQAAVMQRSLKVATGADSAEVASSAETVIQNDAEGVDQGTGAAGEDKMTDALAATGPSGSLAIALAPGLLILLGAGAVYLAARRRRLV